MRLPSGIPLAIALLAALAACAPVVAPGPTGASKPADGDRVVSLLPDTLATAQNRSVTFKVLGPAELGAGGKIISDAGGGIISDAGGGIISDAGGGFSSPSFHVAAASDGFVPVAGAAMQLRDFNDETLGQPITTAADGSITLRNVPMDRPLSAVATFKLGDKTYRLAVVVAKQEAPGVLKADPINTMVDARVRQVIGDNQQSSALDFTHLERVHAICDKANVAIPTSALVNGQPLSVLNDVWTREINAKVTDPAEKQEITSFVQSIKPPAP